MYRESGNRFRRNGYERVADLFLGNIDFRYIQHPCAGVGVSKLSGRADRVELRHHRHDHAAGLSVLQEQTRLNTRIEFWLTIWQERHAG